MTLERIRIGAVSRGGKADTKESPETILGSMTQGQAEIATKFRWAEMLPT